MAEKLTPVKIVIEVDEDGQASCVVNGEINLCEVPGACGFSFAFGAGLDAVTPCLTLDTLTGTLKGRPETLVSLLRWTPWAAHRDKEG